MSQSTRDRILKTALKHFGQYGYEGTSLRNLLGDAGANVAAANYYFGSKANLLQAVFDCYIVDTYPYRFELLDKAAARKGDPDQLRRLIEAFMRPHLEMTIRQQDEAFARFQLSLYGSGDKALLQEINRLQCPVRQRFGEILAELRPDVPKAAILQAIRLVSASIGVAPFKVDPETHAVGGLQTDFEETLDDAVTFVLGGIERLFDRHGARASERIREAEHGA